MVKVNLAVTEIIVYRIRTHTMYTHMCPGGYFRGGTILEPFTCLYSSRVALKLVPLFSTARDSELHKNSPLGCTENLTEFT